MVKTSDQTPTVPYHEVVDMSVWFTSVYPPKPVTWCCITTGNCTDMTDDLIIHGNLSTPLYETKLTIWSVEDYNWGRYILSVCHHIIQNFTIYPFEGQLLSITTLTQQLPVAIFPYFLYI